MQCVRSFLYEYLLIHIHLFYVVYYIVYTHEDEHEHITNWNVDTCLFKQFPVTHYDQINMK